MQFAICKFLPWTAVVKFLPVLPVRGQMTADSNFCEEINFALNQSTIKVKAFLRPRQREYIKPRTMETLYIFFSFSSQVMMGTSHSGSAMELKQIFFFYFDIFPGIWRPERPPSSHIRAGLAWTYVYSGHFKPTEQTYSSFLLPHLQLI
jgi:hypothetical protein